MTNETITLSERQKVYIRRMFNVFISSSTARIYDQSKHAHFASVDSIDGNSYLVKLPRNETLYSVIDHFYKKDLQDYQ